MPALRWDGIRLARVSIPAVLMAVLFSVGTAHALASEPYVVYTANKQVDGAVILRSEPATGSTVEISRNGPLGNLFHEPYDLAVEADGGIVVADMGVPNQKDGSVIRVDPVTGRQSLVASGGSFYDPAGIAIGPDGMLYVLDNLAGPNSGAVIKVNPVTGVQQLIASNFTLDPTKLFDLPFGIAVRPNGQIIVVNRSLTGALPLGCLIGVGRVFAVDPVSFVQSNISNLGRLAYPLGVAIDKDGSLVVANECGGLGADGLVRILPGGTQQQITTNNSDDVLQTPERVGIEPAGNLLVSDYSTGPDGDGGIVKVNPSTGEQSAVTTDSLFNHPLGIAVVPNRPPTAALAVVPKVVAAGRQVTLDASGSRDPEGLRLVYEWDLDGNGTFEAGSGTTPTAMPRFAGDGIKTVRVRVDDPHGGQSVAQGTVDVDGSKPLLTGLRAVARVLGLPPTRAHRRPRAARSRPPSATTVSFRLSEAATVTLTTDRVRKGRRPKGRACSTRAKRGRPCSVLSRARKITRSAQAGENRIAVRARGLKPGRFRLVLTAADEVGNRSPRRTLGLRVVRLSR
jgi:DNA-binding beta-propeller fold protein YncE